jgi:REP element-mobilizing transposase RayT
LKDYDYSQNNAYYITLCTYKKTRLFGDIVGAAPCGRPNGADKIIEKWLLKIEEKFIGAKIDKYVIMPAPLHFILILSGDHAGSPLHKMIDWFKTVTTNEYIQGVKNGVYLAFDTHIWQRNYYEHIIHNEHDYQEIWNYIDTNPVNWDEEH